MLTRHPTTLRAIASLLIPAWLLVSAATVLAKGEIQARLDAALPKNAPPGTVVTVGWTLAVLEGDTWTGIDPGDVFVRLIGSDGGVTEARANGNGAGHFVARVAVPAGGIAFAWIGSDGRCIGPTCARTPEQLFTISGIGAVPAIVPANELQAAIDPLPTLGPPYTQVDVTVRVSLRPGVELSDRILPGSLIVRALDARTNLATYADATPVGQGAYRATLDLPSAGSLSIEAGTKVAERRALDQVLARVPTPLVVPTVDSAATAPVATAVPIPAGSVGAAAGGSEAPLALGALAAASVVLIGLVLAWRAQRRSTGA